MIKLTISERHRTIILLNEFKGNLDTLVSILDDIKKLAITDEEWKKAERAVEIVKNEKGEDVSQWRWNDVKGGEKEIEFEKKTLEYLKETIDKKDKAGELTLADALLVSLNNKLK